MLHMSKKKCTFAGQNVKINDNTYEALILIVGCMWFATLVCR